MSRHALEIADIFRAHGPAIGHRSLPDARWERNSMWWPSRSPSVSRGSSGSRGAVRSQHPILLLWSDNDETANFA